MELMIDAIARRLGKEPNDVRAIDLVRPEQMPYDNVTDKHFDSGDYPQLLRMAADAIDVSAIRARQKRGEANGRLDRARYFDIFPNRPVMAKLPTANDAFSTSRRLPESHLMDVSRSGPAFKASDRASKRRLRRSAANARSRSTTYRSNSAIPNYRPIRVALGVRGV